MSEPSYITAEEAWAYVERENGNPPRLRAPNLIEGAATWRAAEALVDEHFKFAGEVASCECGHSSDEHDFPRPSGRWCTKCSCADFRPSPALTGEAIVPADGSER